MLNRVKLSITGKNPDYFLKELIKRNISIYKTDKNYHELQVIIDYPDLEIINSIKTTYKLRIIKRYGLNKYQFLLKKYSLFLLFMLFGLIINIVLANLIFDIEVVHSNQELVKTVKSDLASYGLKKYHFKVSYNKKERIKKELLAKEKDLLEWVEIEEQGTKYIIKVEQRKKNISKEKCLPRHIIAKKNAIIKEIDAASGEMVKKKNDYVSKGEVLISGLIYNKEDIVSKRCAIGKVYGEVWYRVKTQVPKKYQKTLKTEEEKNGFTVNFLNKEYDLFCNYKTYEKKVYNIVESKIIPLNLGFAKYQKTNEVVTNINTKTVDSFALEAATKELEKQLKKDESIIMKKVLKKKEINSKIEVEVFFKVLENITDYFDITDLNIEEMNEKEE